MSSLMREYNKELKAMNVSICMTQSWIAWGVSYSKVSTREHLKMTLPYAWLVCIIMQAITYVMFG